LRRLISILLLAVFGLPVVSPLFAATQAGMPGCLPVAEGMGSQSNRFLIDIDVCGSNTFLPMLRNSIRMKASGPQFQKNCDEDRNAIEAVGEVLLGSNRPFVITSGTAIAKNVDGKPATEDGPVVSWNPRGLQRRQ